MDVKDKTIKDKRKLIILIVILVCLILSYVSLVGYNLYKVVTTKDVVYSNIYLENFDLSGYDFARVNNKIEFYNDTILDKKINIKCNGKEYVYSFKELGLSVDRDMIIKEIKDYQDNMSYSDKIKAVNNKLDKKVFKYKFISS